MFNENTKVLHLESTSICNAECPQCPREDPLLFKKEKSKNLSLSKCKELFSPVFIKGLDKMFMCGNFGDPVASTHALEIFKYFKKHNKQITLGLNTNGSIQNASWWQELASIFSNNTDYVVFSIDGLKNTNHLYRKNVNWDKVISNAITYINAGGSAHWDMLVFKLVNSWDNNPHTVCSTNCGTNINNTTSFEAQWNKEIQLR
jgi:MoaA/NifB/PqqE/SkfB family radical SAM enzyme